MDSKILQLNFKLGVSSAEYETVASAIAGEFAKVDGLRWKVWILNKAESEAGGIYLFKDETSLKAFLDGPLAAQVAGHPAVKDLSVKRFDVMGDATAVTRGPV